MRIAHVANFYGPTSGGLRTAMHALGAGYMEHGHDYLMVVPGEHDADEETPFGRRVTIQSPVLPLSGGYRVISSTKEVKGILTGYQPDVLEVSDRTTLSGLGKWAAKRAIPAVFIAHERADGILRANLAPLLARPFVVEGIADSHNRGIDRRFATVVATTQYAAGEFERIGVPSVIVPLGVDLHRFSPERADADVRREFAAPGEHLLLMASRLSPEKRPDLAIEAVRILADQGHKVRLVSAGSGSLAKEMHTLAAGAPVTFLGFVTGRERFAALLASADVIVAPGPIETFGLAALEGLASGTPPVVNVNSALPEVVKDAGVSAASTPEAFAEGILTVLAKDPEQRRRAARAQAETLPWSETVNRMLEIHAKATGNTET